MVDRPPGLPAGTIPVHDRGLAGPCPAALRWEYCPWCFDQAMYLGRWPSEGPARLWPACFSCRGCGRDWQRFISEEELRR